MKILVACEESQAVTIELRKLGHEAYSCDLQECSGGHPEWHLQQDVIPLLNKKWDMIIAFPPCTYLSNAGATRLYPYPGYVDSNRFYKGLAAKDFFMRFYNCDCPRIAIENPVPSKIYGLPEYSQIIEPWQFGHPYTKRTCLWLKGLPILYPTNIVKPENAWVFSCDNSDRAKNRAKTFPGIAAAMAYQWTEEIQLSLVL